MQNMASARNQEKQAREKILTRASTKSHANNTKNGRKEKKEKTNDQNDELTYPQTLLNEIEMRDSTIDQLRQELHEVKKSNRLLIDELENIRGKLGESIATETNIQRMLLVRESIEKRDKPTRNAGNSGNARTAAR